MNKNNTLSAPAEVVHDGAGSPAKETNLPARTSPAFTATQPAAPARADDDVLPDVQQNGAGKKEYFSPYAETFAQNILPIGQKVVLLQSRQKTETE